MENTLNIILLGIIALLAIGALFRKQYILFCLFLVGLTQISEKFPFLDAYRIELCVGLFSLVIVLFTTHSLGRLSLSSSKINRYFFAFVFAVALSVPFSISPPDSLEWLVYYFKRCFVYFILFVALVENTDQVRKFVGIYLLGTFWLAMSGFSDFISKENIVVVGGVERILGTTGLLSNPNALANTLVQTIPFFVYTAIPHRPKIKYLMWSAALICIATVVMTGSRGGFIGLVASIGFISLFSKRKVLAVVLSGMLLAVSTFFMSSNLLARYATIAEIGGSDISAHSRLDGLLHGISMFVRKPILGVGVGCYAIARKAWYNWGLWAHNTYGQIIGELGIVGTVAWAGLIYSTVRGARDLRTRLSDRSDPEGRYLYYLMLAVEVSTYARLVLGMTTHSVHIFFWYLNAALVVTAHAIVQDRNGVLVPIGTPARA